MIGWSINLTDHQHYQVELPVPGLWEGTAGLVVEVVFWSDNVQRWVHIVAEPFQRVLPQGHLQATVGDLAWLEKVVARAGDDGLRACVSELEQEMVPCA